MVLQKYLVKHDINSLNHNDTYFEALIVVTSEDPFLEPDDDKPNVICSANFPHAVCNLYSAKSPYELGKKLGSKMTKGLVDKCFDDRLPPGLAPLIIHETGSIVRYSPLADDVEDKKDLDKGILEALLKD